jgi:hypothetical protein
VLWLEPRYRVPVRVGLLVLGRVRRPLWEERALVFPVITPELAAEGLLRDRSRVVGLYTRLSLLGLFRSRGRSALSSVRPSEVRVRSTPRNLEVEELEAASDFCLKSITRSARVLPIRSSPAVSVTVRLRLKVRGSVSICVTRASDSESRVLSLAAGTNRRRSAGLPT